MATFLVVFTALLGLAQALPVEEKKAVRKEASPESATMEAIRALDTDHSGKVEKAEVEAFASSQGLSADEVRAEFADLDTNHDGELEADEITNTLNSASSSEAAKASDVTKRSEVETKSQASELESKHVAEHLAVDAEPKHSSRASAASIAADLSTESPATILTAATATAKRTTPDSDALSAQKPSRSLEVQALELDAQQHAGKALAEVFARTAAKALQARSQDNEKATKLEQAAKALRSQTESIKKRAAAETVNAATAAAAAVLREASDKVKTLEEQAVEAESQATKKRAEAKEAMNRALNARSEMSKQPILLELAQRRK